MQDPIAYHLIWTCYGQWLHGDARGYVDRHHNTPGEPYEHNAPQLLNAAANRMTEAACWLAEDQRRCASRAIREVCDHRGWPLENVNVQPDHVHVVVRAPGLMGKRAMKAIKSWASMQLNRGLARRVHWWTADGKVEVVRNEAHLRSVIAYVSNQRFPKVE